MSPMTEGEALAVLRELRDTGDVSDWQAMESALTMAVNRLTAHTAASGGEVVAWQERYLDIDTGEWSQWRYCAKYIYEAHLNFRVPEIEARALYRAPPAAVPADALERLVEKWKCDSVNERDYYADALRACADELAALIPKGADHGQR